MSKSNIILYKVLTFIFIGAFLLLLLIFKDENQLNIFMMKGEHAFSDYFNVLMYISDNNPYYNTLNGCGEKVYFPITYLFMQLFTFGVDYREMCMSDCLSNTTSLVSLMVFTCFSILVFAHSLSKLAKKTDFWVLFSIIISSFFLCALERGNFILLSGAFVSYFFAYKDSPLKTCRLWAILALCLATILKVYPALFGLFLLQEKRYKEIAFCICFCIIVVFVPFIFFDNGFDNIPKLLSNLSENSANRGFSNLFLRYSFGSTTYYITTKIIHSSEYINLFAIIARGYVIVLSLFSVFAFWLENCLWKKVALLSFVILELPINSAIYCGIYIIPMIIYMFDSNQFNKTDIIYIIGVSLILCPLQFVAKTSPLTHHISNLAIIVMWTILVCEALFQKKRISKHANPLTVV